jgi:DNA mismatch repair protein MutH
VDKAEAIKKLRQLIGQDLRPLADKFGVTVWKLEKLNKGWAGHTIERHLGLALNSSRAPNLGSWELKVVPLVQRTRSGLRVKETMAITMLDPIEVAAQPFEKSHLFNKLRKILIVARVFESLKEKCSIVYYVGDFALENPDIFKQVKADYDLIRKTIVEEGFGALSSSLGVLIQARTKGPGHGSTSRAFYARTRFVAHILNLSPWEGGPKAAASIAVPRVK